MGLSQKKAFIKRTFDICLALLGLLATGWIIIIAWALSTISTGSNGFFTQDRVGRNGKLFKVIKIRTMKDEQGIDTTVTVSCDPRITALGRFFRKLKIDELPQLINVLVGQMSFVGPRPDVPGFADHLSGDDVIVLSVRPGITGPATIKYRNEEQLLAKHKDPEAFNRDVIFPDKVRINKQYIENYSFKNDLYYIWKTLIG